MQVELRKNGKLRLLVDCPEGATETAALMEFREAVASGATVKVEATETGVALVLG